MNRIIKLATWLCVLVCLTTCIGCEKKPDPKPILKVITTSEIAPVVFLYKRYYIVYDNGKTKKISEFEPIKSTSYAFDPSAEEKSNPYLHNIDTNTEEGNILNKIAMNIVSLTDKNEDNSIFSPSELYIIDNKYYFYALIDKLGDSSDNGLFEYLVDDNSFKKIATFNNNITHVEAYQ